MSSPNLRGFGGAKRRRRLVHDQDTRIEMDGSGDSDRLTLTTESFDTGSLNRRKFGLSRCITLRHSASMATSSNVPNAVFNSRPR